MGLECTRNQYEGYKNYLAVIIGPV